MPALSAVDARERIKQARRRLPGIAFAVIAGALCVVFAQLVSGVSALLIAIVLGMVAGNLRLVPSWARGGVAWSTKPLLRAGVVVLGFQLAVGEVLQLGVRGLVTITVTASVTFAATMLIGRVIRTTRATRLLVATGFAICGASAVVAMSAVIDDEDRDAEVAQAIALVTVYGTITLFVMPLLQPVTGFDDTSMGLWIGASVHEVAQVVASASAVSAVAVAVATVAKLGRVVLLAPLVAGVSVVSTLWQRGGRMDTPDRARTARPPIVPLFVVGFLVAVAIRTLVPMPEAFIDAAGYGATILFAIAMFCLGTSVDVRSLIRTGDKATLLGGFATVVAIAASFATLTLLH